MSEPNRISRKWRGKACRIDIHFGEAGADLFLLKEGKQVSDHFGEFAIIQTGNASANAAVLVTTDERMFADLEEHALKAGWKDTKPMLLREGQANGLEKDASALSGRHAVTKAISLAVHLGASRIYLNHARHIGPRTMRNLETMFRPLKGHRVSLFSLDADLPGVARAEVAK